jgi:hypothetical protein
MNALHFFVIKGNTEGITLCCKNGIKFISDCFGKTPLDYAHELMNQNVLDATILGIL